MQPEVVGENSHVPGVSIRSAYKRTGSPAKDLGLTTPVCPQIMIIYDVHVAYILQLDDA